MKINSLFNFSYFRQNSVEKTKEKEHQLETDRARKETEDQLRQEQSKDQGFFGLG